MLTESENSDVNSVREDHEPRVQHNLLDKIMSFVDGARRSCEHLRDTKYGTQRRSYNPVSSHQTPSRGHDLRQWEDHRPIRHHDLPSSWDEVRREYDHRDDDKHAQHECDPKSLEDLRHLEPEVRALDLLLRRAPRNVVGEKMREQGLREMDGEAAEEEEALKMTTIKNCAKEGQ